LIVARQKGSQEFWFYAATKKAWRWSSHASTTAPKSSIGVQSPRFDQTRNPSASDEGKTSINYDLIAIRDAEVPKAVEPVFQHVVTTYASEANKTVSMWRAVPDDLLDFKPHEKTNPIRTILVHQLLSERRFFGQFVGTQEPPVEELLPSGEKPTVQAYIVKYLWLVKGRLPQLAAGTT